MEKTEWPSSRKLEKLRESGILPYSTFAAACLAALFLSVSGFVLEGRWHTLLSSWRSFSVQPGTFSLLGWWRATGADLKDVVYLFAVPAAAVFVACLLSAALQTRFFFRPSLLGLSPGRLSPFRILPLSVVMGRLSSLCARSLLALAAGLIAVYVLAPQVLGLLNHDRDFFVKWLAQQAGLALPVILLVFLVLGGLSMLMSELAFRFSHRMSRQEQEREARED